MIKYMYDETFTAASPAAGITNYINVALGNTEHISESGFLTWEYLPIIPTKVSGGYSSYFQFYFIN